MIVSITVSSQQSVLYKGTVKDAITQENIPFATIVMYNNTDLIDGVSTDNDGIFLLRITEKITHLEVSFIGYKKDIITITDIENSNQINVLLETSDTELDEIIINAERTTTQLKIDRKVINIGADLQQSGTTALEAFDQVSEIQTDLGTGTISLRGSGNIQLLVNGKPSAMPTTELLDQIPASSIDKIEIITSPSAKNQANGISGIINIVLKKDISNGLNLTLNSSVGTKRYGYGFNANYNFSSFNVRLNAVNNTRNLDSKQWINQRYTNGNTRDFFSPHDFNGKVKRISSGIDFFINAKNELSLEIDHTNDYHSFFNDTYYSNVTGRDDYIYTRNSSHEHKTIVYNVNYRRKFNKNDHFLEVEYNINKNKNILPATDFEEGIFLFNESQRNNNDLYALALDYVVPIKNTTIETGVSWNQRTLKSFKDFEPSEGIDTHDVFNYQENLIGIYGLAKFSIGKLNWQTGLRYEYFTSDSDNTINSQITDLKFSNIFPSLHFSYKSNDINTFSLGYSKRISRPNFHHINPFQIGNQYFQWNANPNLEPEFADNFELNHQYNRKRLNTSISIFYRNKTNVIQWIETIDSDGVRVISFENIGSRDSYGVESNIQYKITDFWNSGFSANYYYTKANQPNITWDDLYNSSIILKNTFKITKSIGTDITYRHTPKNQNIYSITQARNRIDWAIKVKFLDNKLTANLRIVDLLNNNLRKRTMVLPNITQDETWKFQSQTFGWLFTLNYKLFQNKGNIRNRKQRDYDYGGATD
ncbi:outer membrane beta-barrel family protein [Aquimarina sp. 2201CG5-10]|uniref:outer membrane beta-barrel family protein n=1 Tax=Aquimarina callyspongiae TaxID=3098150 RepID=UPI002AC95FA0|nr:outer membrane beta-barrel family protein [Aquimarina sp. 2201CG5-10]